MTSTRRLPPDRLYDLPALGMLLKIRRIKQDLAWIRRRLGATSSEIETHRTAALRATCLHAYRHSPFYRKLWDAAGLTIGDLETMRSPSVLPLVSKDEFQAAWPHGLCSDVHLLRRSHMVSTTGSTGRSVQVSMDRGMVLFTIALFCRPSMSMHFGLPLERGIDIMVQDPRAIEAQALREIPRAKKQFFDALAPVAAIIDLINRLQPQYVRSYPGIIREVAAEARRRGIAMWQPKYFIFAGENLTPQALTSIKRTFPDIVVTQAYCATEVTGIAAQCSQGPGLHVLEYKTIVEIIDDAGRPVEPGVTGRIVVTDLMNRVTPVIRYTGLSDFGAWADKPCTCPLKAYPLLARIDGRSAETIQLPDGRVLHQFAVTMALEHLDYVAAFQVRQESENTVRLLIVPESSIDRSASVQTMIRAEALSRLQPVLPGLTIVVDIVPTIMREPGSHKTPVVVNLLHQSTAS